MPDADSDMDRIRIEKAVRDSQDMEFALMEPSTDRNLRALAEFFHQCLLFPGIGECVLQMGEDLLRRIEAVDSALPLGIQRLYDIGRLKSVQRACFHALMDKTKMGGRNTGLFQDCFHMLFVGYGQRFPDRQKRRQI